MNKLLSIIIPTRNRQIYCIESIKSILIDIDERCEIVIQDNSDDNSLCKMIMQLNCSNIIYNYNSLPLSFVDNFEGAILQSNGKYFIILGDDDSTTKDIISIVEWMEKENIESISSSFVVDYIWPNQNIEKYATGYLSVPNYSGRIENVNVGKNLHELIKNGFLTYQAFNLPRTYHGIVKRSCMDEVRRISGRYFGGLTPDIYSTVALACVIKNHKIIDFPFSIAGACPASATVNATVGGHSGELKDAPHFNNRGSYEWEPIIPNYYSVETIWAESGIKALIDMKHNYWKKDFNKYKLYVSGIYANRKYIFKLSLFETVKLNNVLGISKVNHIFNLGKTFIQIVIKKLRIKNEGLNKPFLFEEYNVPNLENCKEIVNSRLPFSGLLK